MDKKEYIVKQKTLTSLVAWLNESEDFNKLPGTKFTTGDLQNYIKRGYLPEYMGTYEIERDEKIEDAKLYNIVKK